ncbi:hypothetical protein OG889_40360 [Streptomyces sp. NBC_00481]|uniref:hypothetical protein n=1 Tax=Streptomyces sp. NBC_00481 TaxID=2975755 RepID=UPI002DDBEC61|nr:hypothetical protein [Streptomyces sp. NBC_00481]WRZ00390.1 hypothetical protein OG889_40360 [Streptomyces sp. NBC_00481]
MRSGLLPRHRREAHRLKVREYEGAVAERDEHRDKVVEAAGILASQPHTSREFKQAVMDFGMSRTLAERNDQRARQLAGPAQTAQAALAQDDSLRQAKASLIEQGDKAERKLNWLLRGRLADAIRDRALLPIWTACPASVLDPLRCLPLGKLPLARHTTGRYRGAPSPVPCESGRPGSRRLHAGHYLASKRIAARLIPELAKDPGFDVICLLNDASATIRLRSSSRSPPDVSYDAFCSIANHGSH